MANFSKSKDEIPYPLPLTTLAPTTTKLTTTALVLNQVPTPLMTFNLNQSPLQPKTSTSTVAGTRRNSCFSKEKSQPAQLTRSEPVAFLAISPWKKLYCFWLQWKKFSCLATWNGRWWSTSIIQTMEQAIQRSNNHSQGWLQ
jgi:hypothetical protein